MESLDHEHLTNMAGVPKMSRYTSKTMWKNTTSITPCRATIE